ncbi:MAG: acyltransferase [Deltaproteobacteria bacterium]
MVSIDAMRAMACIAIVLHHWLLLMPYRKNSDLVDALVSFSGDFVYVFFILSGLGLTLSYFRRPSMPWKKWARTRFKKIVLPFWIVVLLTFVLAHLMRVAGIEISGKPYALSTLIAYLSFTRNFFPDSFTLNGTLWFMPVIIGLYALFPCLIWMIRKWGILLTLSAVCLVGYSAKLMSEALGCPVDYQRALPLFYLPEFMTGVLMGYLLSHRADSRKGFPLPWVILGLIFYLSAGQLPAWFDTAWVFDETLRAIGVWLMMWPVCARLNREPPGPWIGRLVKWSSISFVAYLIHCPLITYLLKPAALRLGISSLNPVAMVVLGAGYVWLIYLLGRRIAYWIHHLASRNHSLPIPQTNALFLE